MFAPPLQIIDSFLLGYNVGDALIALLVLGILATIPLKSWKVLTLHLLLFGLIFLLTPNSLFAVNPTGSFLLSSALQYKLLGLALLVVSPVLFTTASR